MDNIWRHLKKLNKKKFITWQEQENFTIEITDLGLSQLQKERNNADNRYFKGKL
jgi:DNA-binding PadR family transcriptional regulator